VGTALLIAGMLLRFVGARSLVLAGSGLAAALGGGAVTAALAGSPGSASGVVDQT
jgi:hypothetical protein